MRPRPVLLALSASLLLAACGTTVTTGGSVLTSGAASGTIQSLDLSANTAVVAGSTISLQDLSVTRNGVTVADSALTVGQVVDAQAGAEVSGAAVDVRGRVPTRVDIHTDLDGTVTAVDAAAGTLTVGGVVVHVDAQTRIHTDAHRRDSAGTTDVSALRVGTRVEISLVDPGAETSVAASIEAYSERRRAQDSTDERTRVSTLHGVISALDSAARTFRIGDVTVDYSAALVPTLPVDGQPAEIAGVYDAATTTLRARVVAVHPQRPGDRGFLRVHGRVSALDPAAKTFMVGDVTVDYSRVELQGTLGDGAAVMVAGTVEAGGVLVARRVEVRGDERPREGSALAIEGRIHGLNAEKKVFDIRGIVIDYSQATVRGTLREDAGVRVRGTLSLTTPNLLVASELQARE